LAGMSRDSPGRLLFGATAVSVVAGLLISVVVAGNGPSRFPGHFHTPVARGFNQFAYFTIQSNILVGVTCALLAIQPKLSSTALRALRLTSVLAITVTGIVYHTVLSSFFDLQGWVRLGDIFV